MHSSTLLALNLHVLLALVLCCNVIVHCNGAIVPLMAAREHNSALGDWDEWLRLQRAFYQTQQQNLLDKIPNQVPTKFNSAAQQVKRGDEKRRDFEHGWEQCEFSPISCMLRRRR